MAFKKGHAPWNKGIANSTGKYWLGRKRPEAKKWLKPFRKGNVPWNRGKSGSLSLENRRKLSEVNKKRTGALGANWKGGLPNCMGCKKQVWYYSKRCKDCRLAFMRTQRGPLARTWKGGVTPLMLRIRHCRPMREWRESIFQRDHYQCQICGKRGGGILHVDHHPKSFAAIFYENEIATLEQALKCAAFWDLNNGRTLCISCHRKTPTYSRSYKIRAEIEAAKEA